MLPHLRVTSRDLLGAHDLLSELVRVEGAVAVREGLDAVEDDGQDEEDVEKVKHVEQVS